MAQEVNRDKLLEDVASAEVVRFSFDPETHLFTLGDVDVPLSPEWEDVAYDTIKSLPKLNAEALSEVSVVFSGITDTFALPRLKQYLDSIGEVAVGELFEGTKELMAQVHRSVMEMMGQSQWSFAAPDLFHIRRLPGSDMPNLALSTDTSLGPISHGQIGERGWPYGIAEYGTNNEEAVQDRAALFAGLGFIAHKSMIN